MKNIAPENVYCVVLAGGSGTRFWPRSRQSHPKQLCKLGKQDQTMLELTLDRIRDWVPAERILIVTHRDQAEATRKLVGTKVAYVLAEPEAKNTAAALTIAAAWIDQDAASHSSNEESNPILVSLHADHLIQDSQVFLSTLRLAVESAKHGFLTLIGIQPFKPETGYGYLAVGEQVYPDIFRVERFVEKPNHEKAQEFVASKKHLWNSGLFVWQTSTMMKELQSYAPQYTAFYQRLMGQGPDFNKMAALGDIYRSLPQLSIDHAILEKSQRISAVVGKFAWYDVGSWSSLGDCFGTDENNNYIDGDVVILDSRSCSINTATKQLIAVLGLENVIVVVEEDAILVCHNNRAQDVKKIVENLKLKGRPDLC
jgi:mannose-1-phosphate guanylyltransferase